MTQEYEMKRTTGADTAQEMAKRGITCVPIDNFYYREFHYTNLQDAIAQSTRDSLQPGAVRSE